MAVPARAGRGRVGADHARRHRGADKLATECVVNLIRTQSMLATELNGGSVATASPARASTSWPR